MKKMFALIIMMLFVACSMNKDHVEMKKDSDLYNLAMSLKDKIPALDPDANSTIVESKNFTLNVADMMYALKATYGNNASMLANQPVDQIKRVMRGLGEKAAMKKILISEAQKMNLDISDAEFDSLMTSQFAHVGGKEKFMSLMKKRGFDEEFLMKDTRESFLIQKYFDTLKKQKIVLSDADLKKYVMDDTRSVRHILLMTQGKSDQEKKKQYRKMQKIRMRALKGESFAKLAEEFTEDPGSKKTGGLYEYFGRGAMVKPFEEAAFTLEPGKISDIIETQYGYHILTVIDRNKDLQNLDSLRSVLEPKIMAQKGNKIIQETVDSLKKEFAVTVIEL